LKIEVFVNGPLKVNTYLIYNDHYGIIIDPGSMLKDLNDFIRINAIEVEAILLTHGHLDHVAGAPYYKAITNSDIYLHMNDLDLIDKLDLQADYLMMSKPDAFKINKHVNDLDTLLFKTATVEVVHIGGHTAGSVAFICDESIFAGDTLFNYTVGRTDLLGSTTHNELITNIKNKILSKYDSSMIVFPGHGPTTSIGFERENNMMLK
jgi:hydroxyacylglutathione hydrolase